MAKKPKADPPQRSAELGDVARQSELIEKLESEYSALRQECASRAAQLNAERKRMVSIVRAARTANLFGAPPLATAAAE